jgi:hypothetical protein
LTTEQSTNLNDIWDSAAEGVQGLDEYIGTVQSGVFELASEAFGNEQKYGDSVVLTLEVSIDQAIDPSDFKFDTAKIFLSVGKAEAWNILNGGEEIVNSKGGGMGNSKYQQWVKRVVKELQVPIQTRGLSPFQAKVWNGLKFHFKNEHKPIAERLLQERRDRGDANIKETSRITLPQQWLQDQLPPLA